MQTRHHTGLIFELRWMRTDFFREPQSGQSLLCYKRSWFLFVPQVLATEITEVTE